MTNLFQPDGKLYNLLDRLYQLLVLNFLVILTCLPLVTIGATLTAAYGTAYRIAQHKECVLYKEYWRQLKINFVPATKIWLGILALGTGVFFALPFVRDYVLGNKVSYYLVMVLVTVVLLALEYVFPLIAKFDNTLGATLKNALVLSLKHLPISIIVFGVNLAGILLPILLPQGFILWLFVGIGLVLYLNGKLMNAVFLKYS